jgi:hypothetical protein
MYLLTRQAINPTASLAEPIREHLRWLVEHPDLSRQPVLRKTCRRLMLQWQMRDGKAANSDRPDKRPIDARLH